ncbi:helix-turn-helix domain-containing protein [Lacticaseibacillus mingshuiensis]|uniref:helix-turn-helix domain-containing protein n=1 Tax=Lacticaseibacillus mingshuiensis TaxID=2799574 RepID=UPI001951B134|nr:helix-turn-helix transcriptional regulator [Lacticaseibacillus mingshuiensis]
MTLLERVKETSKKQGWSLQQTAQKAGLGINSLYAWKTKTPSADRIQAVADVLHVSVDYLLGNTDDPNPPKKSDKPQTVDLHDQMNDDLTITAWKGRTISPEEREMIRRILDGGGD